MSGYEALIFFHLSHPVWLNVFYFYICKNKNPSGTVLLQRYLLAIHSFCNISKGSKWIFFQAKLFIRKSSFKEPQNVTMSVMTWLPSTSVKRTKVLSVRTLSEQKAGRWQNSNGKMSMPSSQPKPWLPCRYKDQKPVHTTPKYRRKSDTSSWVKSV